MALQAEQVDLASAQQARIRRAMWRMTGDAALGLHRRVLESERPGLVGMAVEANHVLRGCGSELMRQETAVRIVAVVAGDEPFVDAMMERFGKVGFDLQVAGVAELRHDVFQQPRLDSGRMNAVTINAANVVLDMLGAEKIRVLLPELMTA